MSYDLHGSWDRTTGHNAPLVNRTGQDDLTVVNYPSLCVAFSTTRELRDVYERTHWISKQKCGLLCRASYCQAIRTCFSCQNRCCGQLMSLPSRFFCFRNSFHLLKLRILLILRHRRRLPHTGETMGREQTSWLLVSPHTDVASGCRRVSGCHRTCPRLADPREDASPKNRDSWPTTR